MLHSIGGEGRKESDMTEQQRLMTLSTFHVLTCKHFAREESVHNFCPFCSCVVFLILH